MLKHFILPQCVSLKRASKQEIPSDMPLWHDIEGSLPTSSLPSPYLMSKTKIITVVSHISEVEIFCFYKPTLNCNINEYYCYQLLKAFFPGIWMFIFFWINLIKFTRFRMHHWTSVLKYFHIQSFPEQKCQTQKKMNVYLITIPF